MAIYTQYGRYLKAKQFKEMLEDKYEAYMLFGLGNPKWIDNSENQPMPFGPHNTNILLYETSTANQFYDDKVQQWFTDNNTPEQFVSYSKPMTEYARKVAELLPVFPAIWYKHPVPTEQDDPTSDMFTISNDIEIDLMKYQNYYIQKGDDGKGDQALYLRNVTKTGINDVINIPSTPIAKMYFAELYLRGLAIKNNIKAPVGLLGAAKCSLSLVRDLGIDDSNYTGLQNQFWYGDRYWEIVNPNDDALESYIKYKGNTSGVAEYYPTHLLFTSMINPRNLCDDLNIDNCIAPQQLAIYIRKKHYNTDIGAYENGSHYYRVDGNNIFNFGQYNANDIGTLTYHTSTRSYRSDMLGKSVFNFTLPDKNHIYDYNDPNMNDGEFKLLLHDYIKGQIRETHSIERVGYIIGF